MISNRRRLPFATISTAAILIVLFGAAVPVYARQEIVAPASVVEVPVRVVAGHVLVDVAIDGQGPFHFVFDSGASNVLTPRAAKRLGLDVRNNVVATGTGGDQLIGSAKVRSIRLGSVELLNQTTYVLDLPLGASDGPPIDGLIGFDLLNRFPVQLDYIKATLSVFTGANARYSGSSTPMRLSFRGRLPQVEGKIDGISGLFSIDTGSSGSLTLSAPFVAENDLAARYHATTRVMSARGVGGPVYALQTRAELLDLGTVTAKRPVTFLSQQTTGTSARKGTAGNIGFGILRQFTIYFDYPGKQIVFQPNAQWGLPDLADRSGLRLEKIEGALMVAFVAEGSPAAAAGLKAGDSITAVNASPSATMPLEAVRNLLKGEIGTKVSLSLDRGQVQFTLHDL